MQIVNLDVAPLQSHRTQPDRHLLPAPVPTEDLLDDIFDTSKSNSPVSDEVPGLVTDSTTSPVSPESMDFDHGVLLPQPLVELDAVQDAAENMQIICSAEEAPAEDESDLLIDLGSSNGVPVRSTVETQHERFEGSLNLLDGQDSLI